jgi:hypothetical protein
MKISTSLAVVVCQLLAAAGLRAATYYVATNGNNLNPGTQSQPFLTVQKGVDVAHAGDTVLVGPGTYAENVRTADNAGTSGAPIVINGQNVATVGSFSWENPYIQVINFNIKGGVNLWGSMLYVSQTGSNCVLSNNVIDVEFRPAVTPVIRWNGPASAPFGAAGSDNLIISNTIQNIRAEMVFRIYGYRNLICGNRLLNADNSDWFQLAGATNYIIGNLCSNIFNSGQNANNHADFIQIFGDAGGTMQASMAHLIESNIVVKADDVAQIGMLSGDGYPYTKDLTIRNNLFIGMSAKLSCAMPEVKFYNNVFYQCATNDVNGGHVLIFSDSFGGGHGGRVFNNVFLDCGTAGNTNNGWYSIQSTLTNVAADYNYVGKSGYQPVYVDPQHRAVGDPGGWDKFNWWEPHGFNGGNPMFVSETQWDFRLRQGSMLIGTALPMNQLFATDIRGFTRGSQWDIGAYEFQAGEPIALAPPGRLRPQ